MASVWDHFNFITTWEALDVESVLSTEDLNVTILSKLLAKGVSYDPVFGAVFLDAPTDDGWRLSQLGNHVGVHFVCLLCKSCFWSQFQDTRSVVLSLHGKGPSDINHSVLQDLLLDAGLGWFHHVALLDSGHFQVFSAVVWTCQRLTWVVVAFWVLSCVWVAVLSEESNILCEEAIENGPAAFAAFVHVVAGDELLHWEVWNDGHSMLHSESVLDHLDEGVGTGGSAALLVPHFACVVYTVDVS